MTTATQQKPTKATAAPEAPAATNTRRARKADEQYARKLQRMNDDILNLQIAASRLTKAIAADASEMGVGSTEIAALFELNRLRSGALETYRVKLCENLAICKAALNTPGGAINLRRDPATGALVAVNSKMEKGA